MGMNQYRNGFEVTLAPHTLKAPYSWRENKIVFANSMSDLFHEKVPLSYIKKVFKVMNETPQHTYQVLTKRSERLKKLSGKLKWTSNIWMGVSVESNEVVSRIDDLRDIEAKTKFLSIEPLIGTVGRINLNQIDWVIVGGESGPNARPVKKEWILDIFEQCNSSGVEFFFKQWGKPEFNIDPADPTIKKEHPEHAKGGCQLNGKVYKNMPTLAFQQAQTSLQLA